MVVWLVARREIVERGRSRGYVISLLFTVFLLLAGFVLPSLLIGGAGTLQLALVGETPPGLVSSLEETAAALDATLVVTTVPDRRAADSALEAKRVDGALAVPADLSGPGTLVVRGRVDPTLQAIVAGAVVSLRAGTAAQPPSLVVLAPPGDTEFTAILFANAGIVLMFIGIFTYGTWVLTGVVEEKQSRVVEVLLSTVRPRDLLMGKVLGIGVLAIVQLVALVAVGIVAAQPPAASRSRRPPRPPSPSCCCGSSSGSRSTRRRWGRWGRWPRGRRRPTTRRCRSRWSATLAYILSIVVRDRRTRRACWLGS